MDHHGIFRRNDDYWSLAEQLAGEQTPTQVGQALRELGRHAHALECKGAAAHVGKSARQDEQRDQQDMHRFRTRVMGLLRTI